MNSVVTHLMQEFAQAFASFVQLRFGIAHRAAEHAGDFVVLVTVNIVKEEHGFVALRQSLEGSVKVDAVEKAGQAEVGDTDFERGTVFFVVGASHFFQRYGDRPFLAEAHEDDIGGKAVHPGRKGRFAAECMNLAEQLQEGLLGQIFGFNGVATHAQTESVDAAAVQLINGFEGVGVALLGQANGFFERSGIRL